MKLRLLKIMVLSSALFWLVFLSMAEARTSLGGVADLSYVNYDAKSDLNHASGSSLVQKYSLVWNATNLYYRSQPRYYDVTLAYDWLTFDTKYNDENSSYRYKDTFGRLRYNGSVGYNPADIPIKFSAYANDDNNATFKGALDANSILGDTLIYNIQNKIISESYGASFIFDPALARSSAARGFPRLHLDYKEYFTKTLSSVYQMNNKTTELAVAGLSKENNWVQFKSLKYQDILEQKNNFEQQQIQIGLVDYTGKRLWSSLTNWIEVSADGRLTNRKSQDSFEEYDLNFMAIATRRTWTARTFMNYNRLMESPVNSTNSLIEAASIPLYIKGIYGPNTDWYATVSTQSAQRTVYSPIASKNDSHSNTVSVGATTFKRSDFTLSPSLNVSSSKDYTGPANLDVLLSIETLSTNRFSSRASLAARMDFSYQDDGNDSPVSRKWSDTLTVRAKYRAPNNKYSYSISEVLGVGIQNPSNIDPSQASPEKYLTTSTTASVAWTPSAALTNTVEGSYLQHSYERRRGSDETQFSHRISYDNQKSLYRLDTKYSQRNDAAGNSSITLANTGEFQYNPDRYHTGLLRYNYSKTNASSINESKFELTERYTYNFFTRSGVVRSLASVSQEYGYSAQNSNGSTGQSGLQTNSRHYLMFSGRYSPTEKLTLTGSARYTNAKPAQTFAYRAGLNVDFKLFTSSLDYAYAQRDSDNRIEKKLSANVRRSF